MQLRGDDANQASVESQQRARQVIDCRQLVPVRFQVVVDLCQHSIIEAPRPTRGTLEPVLSTVRLRLQTVAPIPCPGSRAATFPLPFAPACCCRANSCWVA